MTPEVIAYGDLTPHKLENSESLSLMVGPYPTKLTNMSKEPVLVKRWAYFKIAENLGYLFGDENCIPPEWITTDSIEIKSR